MLSLLRAAAAAAAAKSHSSIYARTWFCLFPILFSLCFYFFYWNILCALASCLSFRNGIECNTMNLRTHLKYFSSFWPSGMAVWSLAVLGVGKDTGVVPFQIAGHGVPWSQEFLGEFFWSSVNSPRDHQLQQKKRDSFEGLMVKECRKTALWDRKVHLFSLWDVRLKLKGEPLNLPTPTGHKGNFWVKCLGARKHGDRVNTVWPTGFLENTPHWLSHS